MKRISRKNGFTLIECMVVTLILMVTIGGITGFRYYSVLSAERAETELLAAQTAVTISEAWRAQRGTTDFDPVQQGFDQHFQISTIDSSVTKETAPAGALYLGSYQVQADGHEFVATLMYQNDAGVAGARMLHVVLIWQDRTQAQQRFHLSTLTQT